ncbi:bifunctional dTDP-4-dehydrorhamnose 3,5-epimerase family protein/NAD(P)-dependent oxidoreductase [Tessaracoccus sp. OS52]|uniref:sugar nucleotide-binding protein n=1 Tax=Tessaracoccus sp. OS52 TaxID=2886691 RepID=UPI001D1139E1|nr:bifunctional dTDP-4-dehydrorhamnose 3,5-epimerase family protein/NAD(P)-dependent oxidoreductase [Tessaracoccus sp. OS52]MCC2594305.1 bifunctional dTDP-4-dehydrorhamnose 3,5-epimerase family protein/NAD(P)-dependent oxidoreductase [Tessaracoccus sp. OS52]
MADLQVEPTAIDGLLVLRLPIHADNRGWFKENWQRAKMTALGLPDFGPVQQNLAHNHAVGTTRGIHAEPWDKLVSLASGRAYGAWVDLREGPGFGTVVTVELEPGNAVFVPRGVGNSYQTLEPDTSYTYLVNEHWSAEARDRYTYVNLFDPALGIAWPIPREQCELSAADEAHPLLADVVPMAPRRPLVVGAGGQLGRALLAALPGAVGVGHAELEVTDADAVAAFDFSGTSCIINAAAWTAVDAAETDEGRRGAWAVNATAVAHLAAAARRRRIPFVHVSTDYVFDGLTEEHAEDEPLSPLGVYGQSKAAGEQAAATVDDHYIVRTSWVVGEGRNFVRTMARLADEGVRPTVVDDQFGRLTFADDLAAAIAHLLAERAPSGIYNVTNSGPTTTWADVARRVFELRGRDPGDVATTSTADWAKGKVVSPRPRHSTLRLDKIVAAGFQPPPADDRLAAYVAQLGRPDQ